MALPEIQEDDFSQAESEDSLQENHPSRNNQRQSSQVARGQTTAVRVIRIVTIIVLLLAAWTTTGLVFWYAFEEEVVDFEQAFAYDASKVLDTYNTNAFRRLEALESFSTSITQFAISRSKFEDQIVTESSTPSSRNRTSFPFVTLPDFERRARYTLESSEVLGVIFQPLVATEQRDAWNQYSVANADWLDETEESQGQPSPSQQSPQQPQPPPQQPKPKPDRETDNPPLNRRLQGIMPFIFRLDEQEGTPVPEDGEGPYYPIWQSAPVFDDTFMYNYNMRQPFEPELDTVFTTQRPLTTEVFVLSTDPDESVPSTVATDDEADAGIFSAGASYILHQFLVKAYDDEDHDGTTIELGGGISSAFMFPVFDKWNPSSRKVAGVLNVMVYWQLYLSCLLPDVEETLNAPLMAVLENTCQQSYTFELRGASATYVGEGDLHDSNYDHLMMESGYDSVVGFNTSDVEIMPEECLYNLRVYPTKEMEDIYLTEEPYYFATVIFLVFVFTAAVFICCK